MVSWSVLRPRFASVGTKLAGATLLVITLVTAGVYSEVSRNERKALLTAKEDASATVARLFVAGLGAPLTFGDDRGAQEQTSLLLATDDVVYGAVWALRGDADRSRLEKVGEVRRRDFPVEPPSVHRDIRMRRDRQRLFLESPVLDTSGNILGVSQLALSLDKENAALDALERRTLVGSAALALGVSVLLLALTRLFIVRRLARLAAAAKRFERGEPVEIDVAGGDEVSALARAFSAMIVSIATREAYISDRNRDLRRVLDNVGEGFFTVDPVGVMSEERSRVVDEWFGPPTSTLFAVYMDGIAPTLAHSIRLAWEALAEDFMPVEVILDQLQGRFEREGRFYEIELRPINDGAALALVLVVVRDISERVERERANRQQRDQLAIFRRLLADRAGFDEFLAEGSALVEQIVHDDGNDPARTFRAVHTLKGTAGVFEIEGIASLCHEIEQRMLDRGNRTVPAERAAIGAIWAAVRGQRADLDADGKARIELRREEYERLLAAVEGGGDRAVVASFVRGLSEERASTRLTRVAGQLRSIARRLGKSDVEIRTHVSPSDLRLPAERWAAFWTVFVHALRNTIDHGIETVDERIALRKPGPGVVSLSLAADDTGAEVSISDDGRGIAWEKIRARAAALGLPAETAADLEEALFTDAVSSKERASEISGRGVGMGALREAVRACGGTLSIRTAPGTGTTLRVRFPSDMLSSSRESASVAARTAA